MTYVTYTKPTTTVSNPSESETDGDYVISTKNIDGYTYTVTTNSLNIQPNQME